MRYPTAHDDWDEMRGPHRTALRPFRVLLIGMALVAAYVGGYALLVQPGQIAVEMVGLTMRYEIQPQYAVGGPVAEFLFRPAHALDRAWRPERWQGQGLPPSSGPSSRELERGGRPGLRMSPK